MNTHGLATRLTLEGASPDSAPGRATPPPGRQRDHSPAEAVPWLGKYAERLTAARHDPAQFARIFQQSPVPMLLVDDRRRYAEANRPARLAFRARLDRLRQLRIDDLTPKSMIGVLEDLWRRLTVGGCVGGRYEVAGLDGGHFQVCYFGLANVLPGRHLIAFVPAGWPPSELIDGRELSSRPLTPRETEVLQLTANGATVSAAAEALVLSEATIRTHLRNIYSKLEVGDRASAVARAMRLGLIK
jgi:DNA-binding CsgD family transcriptional regulator